MALSLGVDTGGTYTDAVLIRDEKDVIASAKALTTRHDLAEGIGGAVSAVLEQASVDPGDIALASLSTTLATNALVEGQGGRVALILIGFRDGDLGRHGLTGALAGDPALLLAGGHNHAGDQKQPLDEDGLREWLKEHGREVSGYAVAAQFATRNPAHEQRVSAMVQEMTGRPVSCSHHLSSKLNGPKRAMTAVLNARLIGMIDRLINRAEERLNELGVTAPLMVVRGDGALISAEFARERPIETILSGPAASIVGARWMTGAQEALVSDIGGTTTDVAVLRDGRPSIDPDGARVGPYRTMVEAVAMRTSGLGGDSEVHFLGEGLKGGVSLGPRRLLPVSLIALEAPDVVHAALDEQLRNAAPGEHDGRFVRTLAGIPREGLELREETLLARIADQVQPLAKVLRNRIEMKALRRLVERGIVQIAGVTPSDASHVLGNLSSWDREAAEKAIALFGRRRTGSGNMLAPNPADMAEIIVKQLTDQTVLALLETAFSEEVDVFGLPAEQLARHVLIKRGLDGHRGLLRLDAGLNRPVIGLGASASTYYPAVGERLGCQMELPTHAGVANAIGAVVGRVTIRRSGEVSAPAEGRYRVHLESGPLDFTDCEEALGALEKHLSETAQKEAIAAGAEGIRVTVTRDIRTAPAEGREIFIQGLLSVEASGRPRIAAD
ncbi:N-methylhydantoinase A/oxoprolinase/acetone carboxylase, beta subunit [Shimia gijangensis]|uniref:N-methylhydantoinase A/oxoprolinase/acetone carboxylase, beta subunit n=1 Tax=Shimia gijangensis TaxID=1470563 RepID=A0A1M6ARK7_9RHOB|nr:hydantoinase/oxoprolinase family protein [Shimia gijangensis]SHI39051.1 N-methylhydantoinase A/oxoprolinase/acetone carboxylase, beta subunit [Shimia gijangensis]